MELLVEHNYRTLWFWCDSCGIHGDLIKLSSIVWGLGIPETIRKIRNIGFELPPIDNLDLSGHRDWYLDYQVVNQAREQAEKFLAEAYARPLNSSTTISRLIRELRLATKNAGTPLFGWATKTQAERLSYELSPNGGLREDSRTERLVLFRGGLWGDVLVIPTYTMPEKICGFLFIGRDGDPTKDYVYRSIFPNDYDRVTESGITWYPHVLKQTGKRNGPWVHTDNLYIALRLQGKNAHHEGPTLPLSAWIEYKPLTGRRTFETRYTWDNLSGSPKVFWMTDFSVTALANAIRNDAMISTVGPKNRDQVGWEQYLAGVPRLVVDNVIATAVPWYEYFAKLVGGMTRKELESLILKLEDLDVPSHTFLHRCPDDLKKKIMKLEKHQPRLRQISFKGLNTWEQTSGWYCRRSDRVKDDAPGVSLISNVILTIDEVLHADNSRTPWLYGRVIYNGKAIEFHEPVRVLEEKCYTWLRNFTLKNFSIMPVIARSHRPFLMQIAMLFREPLVRKQITDIGWVKSEARFVFPQFSLRLDGHVTTNDIKSFSYGTPCRQLSAPEPCTAEMILEICRGQDGGSFYWVSLAAILANVVAEPLGEKPRGIGVCGETGIAGIKTVAEAVGCHHYDILSHRRLARNTAPINQEQWPFTLCFTSKLQKPWQEWTADLKAVSCRQIVELDTAMWNKAMNSHLVLLKNEGDIPPEPVGPLVIRNVFVNYLQRLCERRFEIKRTSRGLTEDVTKDLIEFIDETALGAVKIAQVLKHLRKT